MTRTLGLQVVGKRLTNQVVFRRQCDLKIVDVIIGFPSLVKVVALSSKIRMSFSLGRDITKGVGGVLGYGLVLNYLHLIVHDYEVMSVRGPCDGNDMSLT